MLEQSQKLTDGLIIYSVLVSDYEKLDFKNDALAGVRANYFNSGCKEQKEITEIELHGMDYKMSCLLTKNEPFSWKVLPSASFSGLLMASISSDLSSG